MNINVFSNLYQEKHQLRKDELDRCICENYNNKYINYILINSDNRLKYNDFFKYANDYSNEEDINIISNLDIYFDETILLSKKITREYFLCLSRWEVRGNDVSFSNRKDSQDVWIWKGKCEKVNGDFYLGVCGCDNHLAYEAKSSGYNVINPSIDIKTYHVHQCGIRNYNQHDRSPANVVQPPYLTLDPCRFQL